jgi:hypothetical protein
MDDLIGDSKICDPNRNNLEGDYEDFLCSVANGADRAVKVAGPQRRFLRLYNDWFPPFGPNELHMHKSYYREVIEWWNIKGIELPIEEPDERFGLYIVILRRKLRVIWLLASSGAEDEAMHKIKQLSTHYYRYYHLGSAHHNCEEQRKKMFEACKWLEENVGKLKVCENPQCQKLTRYFVRRWNNNKYCPGECCKEAKDARAHERAVANARTYQRSPLSREKMSHSATERWRRSRIERDPNDSKHGTRSRKRKRRR